MLIQGNYEKVIDTCKQILTYDSLNPEIYYKMGIAFQNILEEDLSLSSFYKAVNLDPENKVYNFMLAKGYYGKGKLNLAEPLLSKLCSLDSANWVYAYYLTSIYMQHNKFDNAINIYKRFLMKDSANYVYLNKIAFAYLKKGDFRYAFDLYNKSLLINNKNLVAIKNLAYLYSVVMKSDTAIQLLTEGIEIDSSDMDLYIGRAQLNYSKHYTKRALDDYLVILSSGDSSNIYLKRVGIGYCNNFQPREAINYLLIAFKKDSSDFETCSYLGQCYYILKDMKNSIYYYNRVIKILTPVNVQLGLTYSLYAESQKNNGMYKDALASYLKALGISPNLNIYMNIANLYDEKLNDRQKAIYYYEISLDNMKNAKMDLTSKYAESIRKRIEFLKQNPTK
jgi:tetratricopeptide (TPR) repeat protein